MTVYRFNTATVRVGEHTGIRASQDAVESSPSLRRASIENALLFGGPLVRAALQTCPLRGNTPHVLVDTKVTFLMPGWFPAIPGWHTDGVPRGMRKDPAGTGEPDLIEQERLSMLGIIPSFHTVAFGASSLPRFLAEPLDLDLAHGQDRELYAEMSRLVEETVLPDSGPDALVPYEEGQWLTWDWWNIHSATPASERGWRLLLRVTESSVPPSDTGFVRPQNQVYVPTRIGW